MLGMGLVFFGIFRSALAAGAARRDGHTQRLCFWLVILVISMLADLFLSIYLSIPGWARQVLRGLETRLYSLAASHVAQEEDDGGSTNTTLHQPKTRKVMYRPLHCHSQNST